MGPGQRWWLRRQRLEPLLLLAVVASDSGFRSFLLLQPLTTTVAAVREGLPEVAMATVAVAAAAAEICSMRKEK